jgi:putative transposase
MRMRRIKVRGGSEAIYHCMTRAVNGELLFKDREKEMLRKMIVRIADFSGLEVLTYCLMGNHFHLLMRVPERQSLADHELMRRYRVLYPKPTKFQAASALVMERELAANGKDADTIRQKLTARMGDISEFMKTLKQRFSTWFNKTHDRFGPLWADRFKSVLVEGSGNALQTMAAYIDLNSVRAGLVEDPKDYRFCGYAEAVAGRKSAGLALAFITAGLSRSTVEAALEQYGWMLFGKGAAPRCGHGQIVRKAAIRVLEQERGCLSRAAVLHCRIRYFSDGAILGSREFVQSHAEAWQRAGKRKSPSKVCEMAGSDWGGLTVINHLRRAVFS